jgi:general secretion pathway protein G
MNDNPETSVNGDAVHRSFFRLQRSQKGFTLIELIVVVTIIGVLAGLAMLNLRNMKRKALETALKDNLHTMRKAIDNYYADKQHYPESLEALKPNYIRAIPKDPITEQADWEEIREDPLSLEGEDVPAETDPNAFSEPGVIDVKSKAPGKTLDNVPYSDL